MTTAEIHKKYEKYVQLLEANKNLILTGAPGTGKTFMAKEIAWCFIDDMLLKHRHLSDYFEEFYSDLQKVSDVVNNRTMMVQFHPSYDYSDFVEGLRPVTNTESQLGFVRTDGVFKEFCKNACRETVMLKKKYEAISKDADNKIKFNFGKLHESFRDPVYFASLEDLYGNCYEAIINDIEEGSNTWFFYRTKDEFPETVTSHLNSLAIESLDSDWHRIVDKGTDWADDPSFSYSLFCKFFSTIDNVLEGSCPSEEAIKIEVVALWGGVPDSSFKHRNQNIAITSSIAILDNVASFYYALFCWILFYVKSNYERAYLPAIFIIDEINRGEISKIFGELFFSIDPGYRGEKGRVQTQYQNMLEESDLFKNGFFVPDNVYIIGTMNDIDHSVESMDFAMRRRFAFEEVTVEESYQNMIAENDEFSNGEKEEIRKRMFALNDAILNPELRLGEAYQIGAAYFLKYLKYKEKGMEQAFAMLWNNHLKGLLFEYLRGNQNAKTLLEKLEKTYNKKADTHEGTHKDNG